MARLRASADAVLRSARLHLTETEAAWIESLVELGKFSQFYMEADWFDAQLSRAEAQARAWGLVRRNIEGELVVAYPLTESEVRTAYEEAPPRRE